MHLPRIYTRVYTAWAGATLIFFTSLISSSGAFVIADDCINLNAKFETKEDLNMAIKAWETMVQYAIGRAGDPNGLKHRQGNLLQGLLGASDENDEDALAYVISKSNISSWILFLNRGSAAKASYLQRLK